MCATLSTMTERSRGSIRARVRAELVEEIKVVARRQLAADGANLSLRAIARELGMVSSAIYRYYASRDDLLTALILDAYNSLGEAAEQADAAQHTNAVQRADTVQQADTVQRADIVHRPSDYRARWLSVARSIRDWAVASPHEYALIYGSPVPGYVAPQDTVLPSIRPVVVLGGILDEAYKSGCLPKDFPQPRKELRPLLAQVAQGVAPSVDEAVMARALIAWTELFGALSFELFGRFKNTITDLATWYEHQAEEMATFLGLPH
jgi:AcrR family transcriptional regulator